MLLTECQSELTDSSLNTRSASFQENLTSIWRFVFLCVWERVCVCSCDVKETTECDESLSLKCPCVCPSHFQSRVECFSIFVSELNCIWKRFYSIFLRKGSEIEWFFGKQCKGENCLKNFFLCSWFVHLSKFLKGILNQIISLKNTKIYSFCKISFTLNKVGLLLYELKNLGNFCSSEKLSLRRICFCCRV